MIQASAEAGTPKKGLKPVGQAFRNRAPKLLGLAHSDVSRKAELGWVFYHLHQQRPGKVGLELSNEYLKKRARGITSFFDTVACLADGMGIRVVPLEDNSLYERHHVIDLAIKFAESGVTREDLRKYTTEALKRSRWVSPEEATASIIWVGRALKAISLLDASDPASLRAVLANSNELREMRMLRRIWEENPELVIIGDGHAVRLKGMLDEYSYVCSPSVKLARY